MKDRILLVAIIIALTFTNLKVMAQSDENEASDDKLVVLWTSGDPYIVEYLKAL